MGAMEDCLEFESDPQMVAVARRFVHERLAAWEVGDGVDAAVLVTSELVTNAILHARTSVTLKVVAGDDSIRIEVYDENPRLPVMAPCPPEATSGRGLALITNLSRAWGMENRDDGKVVWVELGAAERDAPEDCLDLSGVDTPDQAFEQIRQTDPDTTAS